MIDLQHKLGVHVSGAVPPRPVTSFGHFGFDDTLLKAIRRSDFTQPTPIQVDFWRIRPIWQITSYDDDESLAVLEIFLDG